MERPEHREIGLAPGRTKESRGPARRVRDCGVALADLALGLARPAAPQAGVAPGVVAEVVAGLRDAARHLRRSTGAAADEEERGAHLLPLQDVEHARGPLRIGTVVEGERDRATVAGAPPDRPHGEQVRSPGVGAPDGGHGTGQEPGRAFHAVGRLATSRVSRPLCTRSPSWLRIRRSSITTPPSFIERLATVVDTLWMVSPTRVGLRKRHSKPMKARTTSGACGTRQPSPEDRHSGMRSGIAPGSAGRDPVNAPNIAA